MKTKLLLIAMLAGIILFVACNDAQKSAADIAIKTAQGAYAVIADKANQYVPDQSKAVREAIDSTKEAYAKGDYAGAFAAARTLPGKIKDLAAAASARKDELTAKWNDLSSKMPGLVAAVQSRESALSKSHKLPAGANDTLASAKQIWSAAAAAFASGQIPDALAKASAAKQKLVDLEPKLGMKPAA
jgi:hypothetical protein